MFQIGKTLVSEEILENDFTCNLNACKGACCVAGDAGAPVTDKESQKLEEVYEKVKPYMRKEGIQAIEAQGKFVTSSFDDDELETPLVNNKECAYVNFNEQGIALCSIEAAYRDQKIDFKKPISCALYPIRIQKLSSFEAVNYDKWDICSPACSLGKELQTPVYKFTKDSLIEKFGEDWYKELEEVATHYAEFKNRT
ncbi:DUF3109 family protein [Psychroflexus planctonicus]|uniref:DUF3109 family protein n=1 Tax=Psychroflexus planctonicus TaxID=1526575 RepID=A0ABQ1SI56_9FLAO|nr:DUF3109 family protein [Psychroflexus planctonicus]GGE34537.1 hypothetical protein GCM10010832_13430 [Psychroflexus planctonicus]